MAHQHGKGGVYRGPKGKIISGKKAHTLAKRGKKVSVHKRGKR